MAVMVALRSAWGWFKKNWYWVVVPIGLLFVWLRRRSPDVVAPELVGADEQHEKMKEEADRKVEAAKAVRDQQLTELQQEHTEAIAELTAEQKKKAEELKDDPAALNEFLLDVSSQMRH